MTTDQNNIEVPTSTPSTPSTPTTPPPQPPPPPPPPEKPAVVLTEEQSLGVEKISTWLRDFYDKPSQKPTWDPLTIDLDVADDADNAAPKVRPDEFRLGGYAGTGKTTIIKTILAELRKEFNIVVSAFTGKAVHVLQRKGIFAQTLHSLMYEVHMEKDGSMSFVRRSVLESCPDLIIVDEASMISTDLYNDLKTYRIPLLFVGDPGQLEPVGDNPNLMARTDYVLSKIHRQAEDNPIITLAQRVRTGGVLGRCPDDGRLWVDSKAVNLKTPILSQADQIICARNETRKKLNDNYRIFLEYTKKSNDPIVEGEKLICLRNNPGMGVFNGQIFWVSKILRFDDQRDAWICDVKDETGRTLYSLPIWARSFDPTYNPKKDRQPTKRVVWVDYAYCITCHKSQGSEWDKVHVIDEWMPPAVWSMQRWRYTAITRAAQRLVYSI